MDDVLSFHTRAYSKSDDLKKTELWKRAITLVQALPILIIKLFIVTIAMIFELFNQIFHCFVPKSLNDIRGQLAVVSFQNTINIFYERKQNTNAFFLSHTKK